MTDTELNVDVLRLVHSQQDMRFFRPIIPGDTINSTAKIVAIEEQPGGESLAVDLHCWNQTGETVQRMTFTAFIRGQGRRPSEENRSRRPSRAPASCLPDHRHGSNLSLCESLRRPQSHSP